MMGVSPSRGGKGSGFSLQSFFAETDKKRISVSIPYAERILFVTVIYPLKGGIFFIKTYPYNFLYTFLNQAEYLQKQDYHQLHQLRHQGQLPNLLILLHPYCAQ